MTTPAVRTSTGSRDEFDLALAREALELADPNALRMALYLLTRDPELAAMRVRVEYSGSWGRDSYVLDDESQAEIRARALDYWRTHFGEPLPPAPGYEEALAIMPLFVGDAALSDAELRYAYEELALEEFPRDAAWSGPPPTDRLADFNAVVIGAGISGLAAAIQLERLGIPYTVIERQSALGGVWRKNTYPDARVDMPHHLFQYKFEKRYPWLEYFPAREATVSYLEHVAAKHGVFENIKFSTDLRRAQWDESSACWRLTLRDSDGTESEVTTNFVLAASGLFTVPRFPNAPGIEKFEGTLFHTSEWNHDCDLTGKRVAILGNGSSGVQLMAHVAGKASSLTQFQRNPQWLAPVAQYREKLRPELSYLFAHFPYYWNWHNFAWHINEQQIQGLQVYDREWQAAGGLISERNDRLREDLLKYIDSQLGDDAELKAKCTPSYAPLVRRLVADNRWYRALRQDHVELVTDRIARFTPTGLVTETGQAYDFDVIICATGFKVSEFLDPVEYVGRDGVRPGDLWKEDGARSYLGFALPGFPNFLMFFGPNGQPRTGGFHSWSEMGARYTAQLMVNMLEAGADTVEVREVAYRDWNERVDEAMKDLIWTEPGYSYYVNELGRVDGNSPWLDADFHEMLVRPTMGDYSMTSRADRLDGDDDTA